MSHTGGFHLTLSVSLLIPDTTIVPQYRIIMIIIIQSQKLPTRPILEEIIKQFQEKIQIKVSWWEHRRLARPSSTVGREMLFLKTILMKPLL